MQVELAEFSLFCLFWITFLFFKGGLTTLGMVTIGDVILVVNKDFAGLLECGWPFFKMEA